MNLIKVLLSVAFLLAATVPSSAAWITCGDVRFLVLGNGFGQLVRNEDMSTETVFSWLRTGSTFHLFEDTEPTQWLLSYDMDGQNMIAIVEGTAQTVSCIVPG